MSNFAPPLDSNGSLLVDFITECLSSSYKIVSHAAHRGRANYDLKARRVTLYEARARFEELREGVTSDVATILWGTEEDLLVDIACRTLVERVSHPVIVEYLRMSAHWKGNPPMESFHERLTRFVRSITAQETSGTDHARTV